MKIDIVIKFVFFLILTCFFTVDTACAGGVRQEHLSKLRMHVTDSITGTPLNNVLAITKAGRFLSDRDGLIEILFDENTTDSDIKLKCLGYENVQLKYNKISPEEIRNVRMKPNNKILEEIMVCRKLPVKSANKVGETVQAKTFDESLGTSLTAMLEKVKGVSSIRTGTTVSKPVIHGMSGHRILLVNNGAKLNGQQWGADHAPEIDMNNCRDVLVIKGSEAVRYGSDALGGVIIMNMAPLSYEGKVLSGHFTVSYGSNGRKVMSTATLEGAFPFMKNLAWRLQGTYADHGDRSTAHYVLNNTGTREYNLSAAMGYRHAHLHIEGSYNYYYDKLGVMQSAQMGSEDMLKERIELGRPVYTEPFGRDIRVPFQKVIHQTANFKADYDFGQRGKLGWQTNWQHDSREEYNNRRLDPTIPTVSLHLNSFQNNLQWGLKCTNWNFFAGSSIEYIENHSRSGTGFVPVIPNYTEMQMGTYGIVRYHRNKVGAEAGVRYDSKVLNAKGYDWTGILYGGKRNFRNITYSVGAHYRCGNNWTLTTDFGVAWRAPHVYELYSNGNDLATGMFVKGDSLMNSERSHKWITSVEYKRRFLTLKLDGFLQWINGYIYDEPTKETVTVISGAYPVFQYRQTPAYFRGFDLDVSVEPFDLLNYRMVTSYIVADEKRTGNYLPYIPSFRLRQELCFKNNRKKVFFSTTLVHKYVAKQNRFDPDTDLIAYTPSAYHTFDLHVQLLFRLKEGKKLKMMASAENVLNKEYKEYTNRSRYYAHDMGRDIRLAATWIF